MGVELPAFFRASKEQRLMSCRSKMSGPTPRVHKSFDKGWRIR